MTFTWFKSLIEIVLCNTKVRQIRAYTCEGLAVHRSIDNPRVWRVTHAQSGMFFSMCDSPSCTQAKAKAERLLTMEGYWQKPIQELQHSLADDRIRVRIAYITERNIQRCNISIENVQTRVAQLNA